MTGHILNKSINFLHSIRGDLIINDIPGRNKSPNGKIYAYQISSRHLNIIKVCGRLIDLLNVNPLINRENLYMKFRKIQ